MERIYTKQNDWKDYLTDLHNGKLCKIDNEMFDYWLGVLPPVYMNERKQVCIDGVVFDKLCTFGFAEGVEYIIDFWRNDDSNAWAKKSIRLNK